jgi:hypothetical protein
VGVQSDFASDEVRSRTRCVVKGLLSNLGTKSIEFIHVFEVRIQIPTASSTCLVDLCANASH